METGENIQNELSYFKAFIRVVKSLNNESYYSNFGSQNIIEERLIEAKDTNHVKQLLLEKYPQFFPNNKIYSKETKDDAQFFYVVIFPLYSWEVKEVKEGNWTCDYCSQTHENKYISKPESGLFGNENYYFCRDNNGDKYTKSQCLVSFTNEFYKENAIPDSQYYVKEDSLNYIYKITEKATDKCYIGKTRNAPFFRWWNHLTHSCSPFGIYLRQTNLSDWSFEVLEILPSNIEDKDVFRIESEYINKYDSINNGFNTLISNKESKIKVIDESILELPLNIE